MAQYAKALPVDTNNNSYVTSIPNYVSNQAWSSVFTVSSMIGLSDKTTVVQLTAVGANALFKWATVSDQSGVSSITATKFDGVIPVGFPQTVVVPQSIMSVGASSLMGANGSNGLYNAIAIKQQATGGSVFGVEF